MANASDKPTRETDKPLYTVGEEIANSVTHGVGAVLSVAGLIALCVVATLRGDIAHIVTFSIYGTTLVLLHTASTLYHALTAPRAKRVFRILDHAAIYSVIAGTYTPFLVLAIRGTLGWILLGFIWALTIIGVVFKSLYVGRFGIISTITYVLMGWLAIFLIRSLLHTLPPAGVAWVLAGGLAYTLGVVFFAWKKLPYGHAMWHLFVLAGASCHYVAVLVFL